MRPDSPAARRPRLTACLAAIVLPLLGLGCSQMPTSGPSAERIQEASAQPGIDSVRVVDVDARIAREVRAQRRQMLFSESLGNQPLPALLIGSGDSVEIHIWEAPPATLFGGGAAVDPRATSSARATVLPEQMVDRAGFIAVPFAGRIKASGQTLQAVEAEIVRRLSGKANQPEAFVRVTRNVTSMVTVVGEVTASLRMPLSSGSERLLDALAAAGGVRQPVNKVTLQVTRGGGFHALPLDVVIRDPSKMCT